MPVIYDLTVLYRRMIKPQDYENATAEVAMKAQLEDGDDIDEVAAQLLGKCRDLAVKAVRAKRLGKSLKEVIGKDEAEVTVVKKTGRGVSDTPEDRGEQEDALPGEEAIAPNEVEETDAELKKRVTAEKRKATAAKKKAKAEEAAAASTGTDLPGEEAPGAEDPYDTSALEDDGGTDVIITATDLQHFITNSVSDKMLTVIDAKEIMVQFGEGAIRVRDIPEGRRNIVHEEVRKTIAANKADKAE